jgi:dipeptidyl aminopeptidase/acylaminoacyl peptidase
MRISVTLKLAIAGLGLSSATVAQQNQPPTPRDLAYFRYFQAAARMQGGSIDAQWMADGRSFWYPTGGIENTVIRRIDPATNRDTTLFDVPRLRQALATALGHAPPYQGLPFRAFTFTGADERLVRFTVENRPIELDLGTYVARPLPPPTPAELARRTPQVVHKAVLALLPDIMEVPSPDGQLFAGIKDNNLQLRSAADGRSTALTEDGIDHFAWDVLGAQWSPNGRLLALTKVDQRAMPPSPIVHWLTTVEDVEWVRLGRSGGPLPQVEVYVVDITSRVRTRIDTGKDPDQLLSLVGWRADGTELVLTRQDRRYKHLDLLAADGATGATRVLLTETAATFVRPAASPLGAPGFKALADGQRFLWMSERTGWNNIYLYDFAGKLIRPLTPVPFPVTDFVAVDDAKGWVYFAANGDPRRPYDSHLYRVGLTGQPAVRLTDAPGMHGSPFYLTAIGLRGENVKFSPDKQYFLDTHSSLDRPTQVDLRRADGTLIRTVAKADTAGIGATGWKPPEEFTVKAADGTTDLYGVIYRPASFDPSKKYPVVDYIYNGPQTTWVPRSFTDGRGLSAGALAQIGFWVVIVDGRGTTERGKQFQDVVYGNFGRNEIPDHVATLKQLFSRHPELDSSRVGVIGGSFGGYMTLRAMLLAPDTYKVGVSNAPVADLYGVNVDMYMGLPRDNAAGYEYASNLKIAANLRGNLLLTHGTSDVNAPFGETIRMIDALTRAAKTYEFVLLPEGTHALAGTDAAYRSAAERHFLERYLLP